MLPSSFEIIIIKFFKKTLPQVPILNALNANNFRNLKVISHYHVLSSFLLCCYNCTCFLQLIICYKLWWEMGYYECKCLVDCLNVKF